jgi:hypothetical protein
MKRSTLAVTCAVVMLVVGGVLLFAPYETFPLWAIWLVGPLLWYLAFAVLVVGLAACFFVEPCRQEMKQVVLQHVAQRSAPRGITREIPAMGGFIL